MLGMKFRRFAGVMRRMLCVTFRGVRMVCRRLVITGFVLLAGFTMMASRVFVMLCCLVVMVRCFLGHVDLPLNANDWASRPEARVACQREAGTYAVCSMHA